MPIITMHIQAEIEYFYYIHFSICLIHSHVHIFQDIILSAHESSLCYTCGSLLLLFLYCRPRTEGADRFWASVEPYCANITDVELKILQEPGVSVL